MDDDKNVLGDWNESGQEELDQKSAKKLVWRTRLSITLTVIKTLLLILLVYIAYTIPVSIFYDFNKQAGFDRLVSTVIETHYPGVEVNNASGGSDAEINPLLTQSTTLKLYREIGDWDVVIGEVSAEKQLFGELDYSLQLDEKYLNQSGLKGFVIPNELLGRGETYVKPNASEPVRSQLEKIDGGNVIQVQFSIKKAMSPKALLKELDNYNISVLNMPVYGGEITEVEVPYSQAGQFTFASTLILNPATRYDENNRPSSWISPLSMQTIERSVDQFYENINWMVNEGGYYASDIDRKRLEYIQENGIKVFGATVTGPIREVEKLLRKEEFHQFRLNGIEVWNWEA
ncbi:anti sigma factor C-terminal domain-containing protein [Virgibacillus kekensis]|uniref:Anti sigma factor C-terminal domain-containing protein n=1 Tax=Virgibacillus kekensis TaxID=202261 RepID=A0ABV9DHD4_9BACI